MKHSKKIPLELRKLLYSQYLQNKHLYKNFEDMCRSYNGLVKLFSDQSEEVQL